MLQLSLRESQYVLQCLVMNQKISLQTTNSSVFVAFFSCLSPAQVASQPSQPWPPPAEMPP